MTYSSGYAGNILRVDLSTGGTERVPTERYSDLFLGGGESPPRSTGMKSPREPTLLIRRTASSS